MKIFFISSIMYKNTEEDLLQPLRILYQCLCWCVNVKGFGRFYPDHIYLHTITPYSASLKIWITPFDYLVMCRPRWRSWMRVRLETQEVAGLTPAEVGNILSWRLIMKYFLRSFSPFRWFKKGSCQFLAKECAQYWLTASRTKPAQ